MSARSVIPSYRIEVARRAADDCVHYGFCTAVCPTYILDGDENDSPRGRIALMKAMLDSGARPNAKTITHVDRCLSCLACATTCAAGVDYRRLVDIARERIEAAGVRATGDRLYRWMLTQTLTRPRFLRAAIAFSRPFQGLAGKLPGRIGAIGRLAAAPGSRAFLRRDKVPAVHPQQPAHELGGVAVLDGCVQSVLGAEINAATRRILSRAGVRVVEPPRALEVACCGAMSLHMGDRAGATRRAAALIDHWAELLATGAIDAVVVTTSGCGTVVRNYHELFETADPGRLERAQSVAQKSVDVSELLARIALPANGGHRGARAAYHDACSLRHGQKVTGPPRRVLGKLGFVVADIPEAHLCCGSAGVYNLLEPAIADRLGKRKANNIAGTSPDVIVAGNLGCLVQISRFASVPVAHFVQLVDWAGGGPAPRGLEGFRPKDVREQPTLEPLAAAPASTEAASNELLW